MTCESCFWKISCNPGDRVERIDWNGDKGDSGYTIGVKGRMGHDDNLDLCGGGRNRCA